MHLFKNRICEHLNINFFKDEESSKMSADSAHVQGISGGESTNSPVASGSKSLTFDAEYVFLVFKYNYCFRQYTMNNYYLIISTMRISPNQVYFVYDVKSIYKLRVSCILL